MNLLTSIIRIFQRAGISRERARRRVTERNLQTALNRNRVLSSAIENLAAGMVITDPRQEDNPMVYANPYLLEMLGYEAKDVIGENCRVFSANLADDPSRQELKEAIRERRPFNGIVANRRSDGTIIWNELRINPIFNNRGELVNFVGLQYDITERKRAMEKITESESRFAALIENTRDAIWLVDKNLNLIIANSAYRELLSRALQIDTDLSKPFESRVPREQRRYWRERYRRAMRGELFREVRELNTENGTIVAELSFNPVRTPDGEIQGVSVFCKDITESHNAMRSLQMLAETDGLTGRLNRHGMQKRLETHLKERPENGLAFFLVDLDGFKFINDTLGHQVGDEIILAVAERLAEVSPEVGRLGGDEFGVIRPDIFSYEEAVPIVHKILEAFQKPVRVSQGEFYISLSIGVSLYPRHATRISDIIQFADMAMYAAKRSGKNGFAFYKDNLRRSAESRLALEAKLRTALEKGEFQLYYQPVYDLQLRTFTGAEALLRWPKGDSFTSPFDLVSVAEDTGLIFALGDWVMRQAFQDTRRMHAAGFDHINVSVNVSGLQMQQRQFLEHTAGLLEETGVSPHSIIFEITESSAIEDFDYVIHVVESLKHMGIKVAIDDFGTGYSSLTYLKKIPADLIKIDKSFISEMMQTGVDREIGRALIELAARLNIITVAEGVETEEQMLYLQRLKCAKVQGYRLSQPIPFDDFLAFLEKNRHRSYFAHN